MNRPRRWGIRLLATFCATALLGSAIPALASARSSALEAPAETSLVFARETAHLVGGEAMVLVKCLGPEDGVCSGTVTLSTGAHRYKAPFSVVGGATQSLAVPVGSTEVGATAVAMARTLQPYGGFARGTQVLHIQ